MVKNKLLLLIPVAGFSLCACGKAPVHYSEADYVAGTLEYKENFRILQLTDIHVSNKDNLDKQLKFLDLTISQANADMIVITGDLFTFADKRTANELFAFIDGYGIPWTCTYGNHDEQCYFSLDWMSERLNNYGSNCIYKDYLDDDVYGNANFVINLVDGTTVKQQLIIIDSNKYNYQKFKGYDFIHQDQVEWYERMVNKTKENNGGTVVPSLAFFHIPTEEFQVAYDLCMENDPTAQKVDLDRWRIGENVSCSGTPSDLFEKMLELGSTKACIVGHDHVNSFCVDYKGIYLCYGIHSTDRIYSDKELMGGQVITMNSANEISIERYFHTYAELEGK